MSLFSTLQMASNALQANQIGLQVVGQNIANVNTPGYSRETLNLVPSGTQKVGKLLIGLGVIQQPITLLYTNFAIVLGLFYSFLPFMVLSLTGVLKRIDPQLIEASKTLGASPRRAFFEVTLPLSLPGILAGSLLVFSLAISSFVVPILIGGFKVHVLPMVVYEQVLSVFDWPFGAANALVLLVLSVGLIGVYIKVTERALRGIV